MLALGMAILLASAVTLYASPEARQAVGIDTYTPKHPFTPGPKRLQVPTGASGIAVLAGGRMWATAHAVSINGAKATAVELSPNALNIAVGRGRDLVAVHTNGSGERVLRRTEGQVVAISWAPNPIEIAYVVKVGVALPAAPDRGRRRQRPADRPVGLAGRGRRGAGTTASWRTSRRTAAWSCAT